MDAETAIRDIPARPITKEVFAPFGEVIAPIKDGVAFGEADARLDLTQGTPRLYIMRLPRKGLVFRQITRHRGVTQCLAALGGKSWLLAVAPPKNFDDPTYAEPTPTPGHGLHDSLCHLSMAVGDLATDLRRRRRASVTEAAGT